MINSPKISIIVPIFNDERYLARCLDSIIKQTYRNIEIILVNDGSIDKTLSICQSYASQDKRIKLLNQTNQGVSAARNNALNHATGDYICFVDADDFVDHRYCESLIKQIRKTKADIAVNSYALYRDKKYYVILQPAPNDRSYDGIYSPEEWLKHTAKNFDVFIPVIMCGKLFKRSLFEKVRFPLGLTIAEDAAIIWQLYLRAKQVSFVNESMYIYCTHSNSAVHTQNPAYAQWKIHCQQVAVLLESQMDICFLKEKTPGLIQNLTHDVCLSSMKNSMLLIKIMDKYQSLRR